MPDTPPVVTISLCSELFPPLLTPFVTVPFAGAGAVPPFMPAPLDGLVLPFVDGSEIAVEVWSAWDIGKENELGETKALAWAAVVGRLKESIMMRLDY